MSLSSNESGEVKINSFESDEVAGEQELQERNFSDNPATSAEIVGWTDKYLVRNVENNVVDNPVVSEENKNTSTEERESLLRVFEKERHLSKEEREQLLSPETLSGLSTEEYIELWSHLAPHYVSHVTRQGFRENSFTYHSAGLGEFHNGFKEILENGKCLKSPNGLEGNERYEDMREDFSSFLEGLRLAEERLETDDRGVTVEKNPWKKLKEKIAATLGSAPNVPDEMAVHLAADRVLDSMYGAETGNQIFVIYPSDLIASQYNFAFNAGDQHSFTKELPNTEQKWNDVFMWDKEHPEKSEISIDAGLVFIPRSTPVDTTTGSRYSEYKRSRDDDGGEQIESKVPDQTISSEEYWMNFFAEHPEQKPKHVVFYDGNPTEAVQNFMKENAITQDSTADSDDENLDFEKNRIRNMEDDSRTQRMEDAVKRQAAVSLLDYLSRHPEIDALECLGPDDWEEVDELASGYKMSYSAGGVVPGNVV